MEPTTPTATLTNWQVWVITLVALLLLVVGVPLVASLPLPIAYSLATLAAVVMVQVTLDVTLAQR